MRSGVGYPDSDIHIEISVIEDSNIYLYEVIGHAMPNLHLSERLANGCNCNWCQQWVYEN